MVTISWIDMVKETIISKRGRSQLILISPSNTPNMTVE